MGVRVRRRAGRGTGTEPSLRRVPATERLGLPDLAGHGPLAAALLTDSLGNGLFAPFGLVYFLKTTSLSLPVIGFSLSAAGFAALAAVPASGQLVDRFGAAPVVIAGNVVSAAEATTAR